MLRNVHCVHIPSAKKYAELHPKTDEKKEKKAKAAKEEKPKQEKKQKPKKEEEEDDIPKEPKSKDPYADLPKRYVNSTVDPRYNGHLGAE